MKYEINATKCQRKFFYEVSLSDVKWDTVGSKVGYTLICHVAPDMNMIVWTEIS